MRAQAAAETDSYAGDGRGRAEAAQPSRPEAQESARRAGQAPAPGAGDGDVRIEDSADAAPEVQAGHAAGGGETPGDMDVGAVSNSRVRYNFSKRHRRLHSDKELSWQYVGPGTYRRVFMAAKKLLLTTNTGPAACDVIYKDGQVRSDGEARR